MITMLAHAAASPVIVTKTTIKSVVQAISHSRPKVTKEQDGAVVIANSGCGWQ